MDGGGGQRQPALVRRRPELSVLHRAVREGWPQVLAASLDWAALHAKTWGVDVWLCSCGGKRTVTAVVTSERTAEEILRNLGLLPAAPPRPVALAQAPPQLELSLG